MHPAKRRSAGSAAGAPASKGPERWAGLPSSTLLPGLTLMTHELCCCEDGPDGAADEAGSRQREGHERPAVGQQPVEEGIVVIRARVEEPELRVVLKARQQLDE